MTPTKREFFDRVVKELSLDTRDPFTLLFANACALADQRDALKSSQSSERRMVDYIYTDER